MSDPIVHITSGVPDSGTGNITTLGLTVQGQGTATLGQMGPLAQGAVTTGAPSYSTGNTNPLSLDTSGNLRTLVTSITNPVAVTGTFWQTTQPISGTVTTNSALTAANNGLTNSRVVAAASTNATSLKGSAGNVAAIDVFNVATYTVFLKLYNKASAPTVGTDTPVWTIPLPAGGGFSRSFMRGEYFSTGIAYAITKLQADSDTTAVAANDVTGRIKWV